MKLIGISGPARCGKDTFAQSLVGFFETRGIKAVRMALADELKKETKSFLLETLGIDSFSEKTEDKNIIRPFLVFWGTDVRRKMSENFWIEKLKENAPSDSIVILSDIRYPNEQRWVKDNGGFCIFIDRLVDGNLLEGANDYEKSLNPKLRENSDYHLTWNSLIDKDNFQDLVDVIVDEVAVNTFPPMHLETWKQTYSLSKK